MRPFKIFIADVVPLSNKGEEAIIRGIEDMLQPNRPVELAVFDYVSEPQQKANITIFPYEWIYEVSGHRMGTKKRLASLSSVTIRLLANIPGKTNRLSTGNGIYEPLKDWFLNSDLILVGHDGVFCPESCGVIFQAHKVGIRTGVLGCGMSDYSIITPIVKPLFKKAVNIADFAVFREKHAYNFIKPLVTDKSKLRLAPDPAFAMQPAEKDAVINILNSLELVKNNSSAKTTPLITATVCQKDVLLRGSFPGARNLKEKMQEHIQYLSSVFSHILRHSSAKILFLPHSLEGNERNDVKTAHDVINTMPADLQKRIAVLDRDLPARILKGIIKYSDFLIGQRAHSLIGSTAVTTPFAGLTTSYDRRTHEIIGEMCRSENNLINIDKTNAEDASKKICKLLDERDAIKEHLKNVMNDFAVQMHDVSKLVLGENE